MSKWIVLAAGALMSVSGLAWLWDGLGIVQVERGWSAVIAGSVIFSAGAVLMGLSTLIRQVEALASATRARGAAEPGAWQNDQPDTLAAPAAPATPAAPALQQAEQTLGAEEGEVMDRPEARERVESPQDMRRPPELRPSDVRPPALRPAPGLPRALVPDFALGTSSSDENQPDEIAEGDKPEARAPEPLRREAPKLHASRREPSRQESSLQEPSTSEAPAGNASASAHWKSLFAKAKASERDADLGAAPAVVSPMAQPVRAPDAPQVRSDADIEGRIARRYESQGVRYSLYEDGSIDAETDTGVYRFGSLVELRAFLDKREG